MLKLLETTVLDGARQGLGGCLPPSAQPPRQMPEN